MHISKAVVAVLLAVMNVAVAAPLSGEAKAIEERAFPPEPETRGGQVYSAKRAIQPEPETRGGQVYSAKRAIQPEPETRGGQVYSAKRAIQPEPETRGGQVYSACESKCGSKATAVRTDTALLQKCVMASVVIPALVGLGRILLVRL